jgi:UDP-GlcNAc:undecaprenyl-phosphate GlcNAc-1-phosphate transferase
MIAPMLAGVAAFVSFLVNLGLIPIIIRISHRFKWYDLPDNRKIHTGLIPRLGGVGMTVAFLAAVLITPLILRLTSPAPPMRIEPRLLVLLAGILMIHLLGLYDDFRSMRAPLKFLAQILCASFVAAAGYGIRALTLPYLGAIPLGVFSFPMTIIWMVSISNALNLIDGMDGLAGGIGAFAAFSMGLIGLIQGQMVTTILAFSLFGAIVGFLVFNFPPAKIFMGDSGSLMIGFSLAVFPLTGISHASAFGTLIVPITLLLVPIIDTVAAIFRRIKNRRPIYSPDKQHIHHKLLDMGLGERQILTVIYGICLYLSIVSITSVILPKETNVYLILVVWIGSMLGYWFLGYLESKKIAATRAREEYKQQQEERAKLG